MVTAPEAAVLLSLASSFDGREPDQYAARAWAEALQNIDFVDARGVIVDHYRHQHWRIMPSHVVDGVRALENERVAAGPNVDELPLPERLQLMDDGPEFTTAYRDWLQDTHRRIRRGEPVEVGPTPVLSERKLSELVS